MSQSDSISCDVLVIGAGFAGSLTALCLNQAGFRVCVLEKDRHPRFAIGESSTPIADMILRDLSKKYNLPWLKHFSRYGSWQQHYPDITCGLKRGFSYFKHEAGKKFETTTSHKNELLVAASVDDELSDTNWLRSDFDSFLAGKLNEYDIPYFDQTEVKAMKQQNGWDITAVKDSQSIKIKADFFIDATGSPKLLNQFLGIGYSNSGFKTYSRALFSHFYGVKEWQSYLEEAGIPTGDFPYRSDYSALHHLLDDGWMWMLRFNDDRCSAGIMIDMDASDASLPAAPEEQWNLYLEKYPSLKELFKDAGYAEVPGHLVQSTRLQRKVDKAAGQNWAALPHTAGFVDPMHSTGIAHTLSGIEKLLDILSEKFTDSEARTALLKSYQQSVFAELQFIDTLVAGSYASLNHFPLFNTYVMLYFIAAIHYEQKRLKGKSPSHFLCSDDLKLQKIIGESYSELQEILLEPVSGREIEKFREKVRNRIEPFNIAGLLNPEAHNMYHHTAVGF